MFTLEQINDAHDRVGNAATLAAYLRELHSIGVESVTSYLCDGHSEFFGSAGYSLESPSAHEPLTIADASNRERFIEHLHLHSQQKTSYVEMSKGWPTAASRNGRWTPLR
jgi:hypothetical protein